MKWGTRWADQWGDCEDTGDRFSNVILKQTSSFGQRTFRLTWDYSTPTKWGQKWGNPWGAFRGWFKIYVNGDLVATQKEQVYSFTAPDEGEVVVGIVTVGPLNGDISYDPGVTAVPGNRVKLAWTRPADDDLSHFNIYSDAGTGTMDYNTIVDTVQARDHTTYTWTSGPLSSGTYKYVVRSVDLAGNEDPNTTVASQAIATWPAAPQGLAYTYDEDTDKVTLTWTGGSGNIYSNGGSGAINYAAAVAAGQSSPWTSGALTGPGTFRYAVRVDDGLEEQNTVYIEFEIDVDEDEVTRPSSPYGLEVEPTAAGEFIISGYHDQRRPTINGGQPAAASEIRVYHDNGTGSMIYGSEIGTTTLSPTAGGQMRWSYTTTGGAYAHGATILFGARAATASGASGVEDENTDTESGVADDTAPGAPTGLAASAVRAMGGGE